MSGRGYNHVANGVVVAQHEFNRHLRDHIGRREGTPKKKHRQSKRRRRNRV
ncbi:hypothetical protein [Actinoallomurus sp. CA-142502]|uniref:hypothetical protein n=1 Tax=Actinoallomurus sp. CA-142502 TaxID=3239885 RepID=UPI003D8E030E